MANTLQRIACVSLVILAVATGTACRRSDAPPAHEAARGGELTASFRSEPANYNRYFAPSAAADLFSLLTQAKLVRVNRQSDAVEPALAETWEQSPDASTLTLHLRRGVTFSDGTPFTSADVLFSFAAAYHEESAIGASLTVAGGRLEPSAQGPDTVVVRFPSPFAPGVRILDNLPILPRHKLEPALKAGTLRTAWTPATPLSEIVGLGPFVLTEHQAGQQLVFSRNPRYWRRGDAGEVLPFLDKLTLVVIPDQQAEAQRLLSGGTDLMGNGDIRAEDYAAFKRMADQGSLRLVDGGIGLDPNTLWFNLKPVAGRDPRPWLRRKEFRQALSYAADRNAIVNTVYLGAAVPVSGPVTPRNATWHTGAPDVAHDPAKARQLLAAIGLTDRNGDGTLDDGTGKPVRFSAIVQQGHTIRERTVALLQEQFRRVGVGLDVVGLDLGGIGKRWQSGDYDAIFHGFQATATDPAMNLDFWLSSGSAHVWNPSQPEPATDWEKEIDGLMRRQAASPVLAERQRIFAEVQRIFAEQAPALYFAAPKVTLAVSPRVRNVSPAPQLPQLLWSADTLAAAPAGR
jgi:peptide/nickel transport system substrate-binding protein